MKHFFKNQFYFTRRERNGIIVLLGILIVLNLVMGIRKYSQPNFATDSNAFLLEIAAIEDSIRVDILLEKSRLTPALFDFDPNAVSKKELISLGASDKLAQTISNYRNKGGRFYKDKDLERVYGMSSELLSSWSKHLIYPLKASSYKSKPSLGRIARVEKVIDPVFLNSADTSSLKLIPGIGSYFANKIVSYRASLGGYRNVNQLNEIYLIDSSMVTQWLPHLRCDSALVKYININNCTDTQLSKHPYISYKIASAIIKYRAQHGDYQSLQVLKKLHLIDDAIFRKIALYLKVHD